MANLRLPSAEHEPIRIYRRIVSLAPVLLLGIALAASPRCCTASTANDGLDHPATWPVDALGWNGSPADLSFLNAPERPAGKHGFLRAIKDKLVFEDGASIRFWGANITADALFGTPPEEVKRQAHRLSELGFNLVRLHHHDSAWVDPNIFGDQAALDTQHLSSSGLDRLDWWIKCLRDEGIYIWLDLHVGRKLKAGDRIDDYDEIAKSAPLADLKGYNYINKSIQKAMRKFDEAYVNHRNLYTKLRYKDEPAIAAMLITNENDITNHYGNALLPDKNVPHHSALYMAQAAAFAAAHGLPRNKVWRSWEQGPAKLFLNDLEHRFDVEMIAHLRAQGVRVPLVTTSTWGNNPLSSLPALTAGDIVDAHAYGGAGEIAKNPIYAPNMVDWLAAAQVAGKPFSVSEWNVEPFPISDRHSIPLYVAASAGSQGWDALMLYAYAQTPLDGPGIPSNWSAYNDPALLAALPAAALLYRRGDVREAATIYAFSPGEGPLFDQSISPQNAIALRTAVDKGRLVIAMPRAMELPWLVESTIPDGARVITNPWRSLLDKTAIEAVSDDGELRRNWEQGTYTIDTPRTQAAMGKIGGKKISLTDVDIMLTTENAMVAVQSLSKMPIDKSDSIMISLAAGSIPKSDNQLPFYSEPLEGQLIIRARKGLKPHVQSAHGIIQRDIPMQYKDGRYRISLGHKLGTHWLVLR